MRAKFLVKQCSVKCFSCALWDVVYFIMDTLPCLSKPPIYIEIMLRYGRNNIWNCWVLHELMWWCHHARLHYFGCVNWEKKYDKNIRLKLIGIKMLSAIISFSCLCFFTDARCVVICFYTHNVTKLARCGTQLGYNTRDMMQWKIVKLSWDRNLASSSTQ